MTQWRNMETSPTFQTPTTALNFGDIGNSLVNRILVTITCFLSLLGALLIIATYIFWKDMRSCSRKILVYISISDSVVAASYMFGVLLPENANSTACVTQSFLSTAANLCSFFWTLFMAIYLYAAVARQTPAHNFLWFFHVIAWGLPLFIVVLAWERGVLGNDRDIYSSGWCWIRVRDHSNDDVIWMFVTDKFWEILVFVLILIFYGLLKCHLRTEVNNEPIDRTYVICNQVHSRWLFWYWVTDPIKNSCFSKWQFFNRSFHSRDINTNCPPCLPQISFNFKPENLVSNQAILLRWCFVTFSSPFIVTLRIPEVINK